VRADYAASDIERKWGQRRSAPRDYIFDRPVLLGTMRMGPDLANVGHRAPSDDEKAPAPGSTNSTASGAPAPAANAGAAPAQSAAAPGVPPPPAAPPAPAAQAPSGAPQTPGSQSAEPPPSGQSGPVAAVPAGPGGAPSPAAATSAQTADTAIAPNTTGASMNEPLQYSAAWHHRHLYRPRSLTTWSTMPSFRYLYEKHKITGEPSADALRLGGPDAPQDGWEIVPSYDAKALVAYLMSLDQSHDLKEVKAATPVSPPAPGKAVK
jgi:hypothetical protein